MGRFKTLVFEDNSKGRREKEKAVRFWRGSGWEIVSETIIPPDRKVPTYSQGSWLSILLGISDGTINVTLYCED